jgi:hypothetical protein
MAFRAGGADGIVRRDTGRRAGAKLSFRVLRSEPFDYVASKKRVFGKGLMIAHGFTVPDMVELVRSGFATFELS